MVDAHDRAALRQELEGKGLSVSDSGPFRVSLDGHSAQDVIRSLATELTLRRTHAPTLEDSYLKIVGTAIE